MKNKINLIKQISKKANFNLPEDYTDFLRKNKNCEIFTEGGYLYLYTLDELLSINKDYEVDKYIPSFLIIGSNGSGVAIMYNKDTATIYSMPVIGLNAKDAILLADNFTLFLYGFMNDTIVIY